MLCYSCQPPSILSGTTSTVVDVIVKLWKMLSMPSSLLGIHFFVSIRQGDGYIILGLDLDMVNVFCLAVSSLVDFTPVQGFHVAISQTSETGE